MGMGRNDRSEMFGYVAAGLTAGGVLTFMLFPFAIPCLALVAVLGAPVLPLAVLGAVLWALFIVARVIARAVRALIRRSGGSLRQLQPTSSRQSMQSAKRGQSAHELS